MENFIHDSIMGEMKYRHSWIKEMPINILDVEYIITIIAKAYNGDDIIDCQRKMYKYVIENIDLIWKNAIPKISQYYSLQGNVHNINVESFVKENIIPKSILLQKNGSCGILCDYVEDSEQGIVVIIMNQEISISSQDEYI